MAFRRGGTHTIAPTPQGDQATVSAWNGAARDALRQILTLDEFHHQGGDAATLFEPVDARDMGMVQLRERLRFTRESHQAIGVMREGF